MLDNYSLRKNVVLRSLEVDDAESFFSAVHEDSAHLSQHGDMTSRKFQTLDSVRNSLSYCSPSDKNIYGIWDHGILSGSVSVTPRYDNRAEICYWLRKSSTKRGLATLAVKVIANEASQEFEGLFAVVNPKNTPSINVIKRAGFVLIRKANGAYLYNYHPNVRDE